MNDEIFKNIYLDKINKLLKFVLERKNCDFYRLKYQEYNKYKEIKNYKDFKSIPLLKKEEIIVTPINKRLFVKNSDIRRYTFTSGTTNQNKPMVMPQLAFNEDSVLKNTLSEKQLIELGVKNILVLLSPLTDLFSKVISVRKKHLNVIPGNINNIGITARLIKETGIEGIITTPTILTFFINNLLEVKYDIKKIKWISLGSEFCTKQRHEYFKSVFPNTKFKFRYGSAEIANNRGYRCEYLSEEPPNVFHPNPRSMVEIIDEDGMLITEQGVAGEIVHTDLVIPKALPFIRYESKDIASINYHECSCGNNMIMALGGKAKYDVLKFNGVVLHIQAIENSIEEVRDYLDQGFQMNVYESNDNGKPVPKLLLKLKLKSDIEETEILRNMLRESISRKLYLSANKTLKYFVDNNIFKPLEIELVSEWKDKSCKTWNIVSHLTDTD